MSWIKLGPSETDAIVHYVMRTYSSHPSNVTLWKVMSRPFRNWESANCWMETEKELEKNKDHQFFILTQNYKEEQNGND